ncbi:hypothetical protein AX16_003739 [Volvariella volvacea WC 439]|nr:hypothetical protein AX16_003739 [Volvariella volvacea WC 439]
MTSTLGLRLSRNLCGNISPKYRLPLQACRQPFSTINTYRLSNRLAIPTTLLKTRPPSPIITASVRIAGITAVGLGLASIARPATVYCDTGNAKAKSSTPDLPPPESIVSVYQLSFGTVAGFCSGVFIKKGLKAVAWFLGGVFVLLQFLASRSVVRVDWGRVATGFENLFYMTEENGTRRAPTIGSAWRWLVDFLTADFQPRASFVAGLILGIRLG